MSNITSKSYPVVTISKAGDQFVIVQNGQLKKLTRDGLAEFLNTLTSNTIIELNDTPDSYVGQQGKALVVAPGEQNMIFEAVTAGNFLALTDTPSAYGGQAGRLAVVNSGETAMEFIDNDFIMLGDTPATYSGQGGKLLAVNAGETATEFVSKEDAQVSGWAQYADTVYTSGSPFSILANTDTVLPNNAGSVIDSQKPSDVATFYNGSVITGRDGDDLLITIDLKATPTNVSTTSLEIWLDIGGSIGELYRRIVTFPKGNGVERPINFTLMAYTLDTWEANGATVYIRADGPADIYDIRYVISRNHKAK